MTEDPRARLRDMMKGAEEIDPQVPPAPPEDQGEAAPPARRCAGLPLNDIGNARRFVEHFGEDLRFVPRVGWFVWSGSHWQADPDSLEVRQRAQLLGDLILDEIPHLDVPDVLAARADELSGLLEERARLAEIPAKDRSAEERKRLVQLGPAIKRAQGAARRITAGSDALRAHAETSGMKARIEAAYYEAETRLSWPVESLDADPLVVNTETGVLRFSVSGQGIERVARVDVLDHARDQRLTKVVRAAWRPGAAAPRWHRFLEEIQPLPEMRAFLQRWLGASMLGVTVQKFAIFHGGGSNGKSVLVDTIARVLGDYAATARIESLTGAGRRGGSEATPDLMPLIGARFVRASEPEGGVQLQEGKIKELTGGEPIQVRGLHKDFVEVHPIFKLTVSVNPKPDIRGTDDGIWRRVMLVPFSQHIGEDRKDPDLIPKLVAEADGILQWLADGAIAYLEGGLQEPEAVRAATTEYRQESDPLGGFLTFSCDVTGDDADRMLSADLVEAFRYHMLETGATPWKDSTVQRRLPTYCLQWRSPRTGKGITKGPSSERAQYFGIRLEAGFKARFEAAPRDQAGRIVGRAKGETGPLAGDDF